MKTKMKTKMLICFILFACMANFIYALPMCDYRPRNCSISCHFWHATEIVHQTDNTGPDQGCPTVYKLPYVEGGMNGCGHEYDYGVMGCVDYIGQYGNRTSANCEQP